MSTMKKTRNRGSHEIVNRDAIVAKIAKAGPDGKIRARSLQGTPMASEFPTPNVLPRELMREMEY